MQIADEVPEGSGANEMADEVPESRGADSRQGSWVPDISP